MEKIDIRLVNEKEYDDIENIVREAFWGVYRPGCVEHYIVHRARENEWLVKVRLEDPKKGFLSDNVQGLWIMKAEDAPAGPQWLEDFHTAYVKYLETLK